MKKVLSVFLALQMLLMIAYPALAEGEFVLRNDIRFGDTMAQVRAKETLGIAEDEGDEDTFWTNHGKVAGFDDVQVMYNFDENGKLYEVKWVLSNRTNADSSDTDYSKLEKAMREKYGTTLGLTNGDCYIITTSALESAVTLYGLYTMLFDNGVGDMRDYDEWDYEYSNGHHVKIELAQYYYGASYSEREYGINVGYKYFSDADLEAARQEKQAESSAVMNDI